MYKLLLFFIIYAYNTASRIYEDLYMGFSEDKDTEFSHDMDVVAVEKYLYLCLAVFCIVCTVVVLFGAAGV